MSEQSDALNLALREKGISLGAIHAAPAIDQQQRNTALPAIALPRAGMQLSTFADNVGRIVGANGLYRRDSAPVTIDPETGRVEEMDAARFQTYVEAHLTTFAWKGNVAQPETMSLREAHGCLRSDVFVRPLRKLRRVNQVRLPVMRRDGSIEILPRGWDPESQVFTMRDSLDWDPSWSPTAAKLFLDSFLREFPFDSPRSHAAHILAMLAVFGSDLLAPDVKRLNFVYRANIPRAGKGLLVATAITPAHGDVRIQAIPEESAEFKRVLDTEALNGSPYIFFDEIERKLVNRTLNSFLTANTWTGRRFHSQQLFAVPQNAIVFLAGNNVELSSDLTGRCLLIDLYVSQADPQQRVIENVITESYLTRPSVRADILAALWALVRNWEKRTRPGSNLTVRGFEKFAHIFGGIVEAAGYDCPLRSVAAEIDPDYASMLALVDRLSSGIKNRAEYDFSEIIDACRELNVFEWHVNKDELTPRARSWLGKTFSEQYAGTTFIISDGRRVKFGRRGEKRMRRYMVEVL